jgi:hypothetical protein
MSSAVGLAKTNSNKNATLPIASSDSALRILGRVRSSHTTAAAKAPAATKASQGWVDRQCVQDDQTEQEGVRDGGCRVHDDTGHRMSKVRNG